MLFGKRAPLLARYDYRLMGGRGNYLEFSGGAAQSMKCFDADFHASTRTMRLFTHDRGDFASIRNERVLIYWPHGFGDLVGLGYILPLLEPTNELWLTRFGDDYVALMEGNEYVFPVFTGSPPAVCAGNGESLKLRDLGMAYDTINGGEQKVVLPRSVYDTCRQRKIRNLLWSSYPETNGQAPFPYHSKARNLAKHISPRSNHRILESGLPLTNSISFAVPPWLTAWVEARLRNRTGFGSRKLCIISRNGYTSTGKNWGHRWREDLPTEKQREGEECRDFMRLLLKRDHRWMFLSMEDRIFTNAHTLRSHDLNCYSYAELFGPIETSNVPFALILKAIVNLASLSIGVPTGPFHLTMAKPGLPTVGIWLEHSPTWYDEPKDCALHLIGSEVLKAHPQLLKDNCEGKNFGHRVITLPTRIISGEQAMCAAESLLH
jgi:hypothetical protein